MPGAVVGLFAIALGLTIAPSGLYFLRICYGIVGLVGFYLGVQAAATAPAIDVLRGVPLAREFVYGLSAAAFSIALLVLLLGIAAVVLPIAYGLDLGTRLFTNPILIYATTLIVGLTGLVAFYLGVWVASAIVGGVLVAVGVQFIFSVADGSAAPYERIAELLRSADFPTIVPDIVAGIGAVGRSGLLFGIAVAVAGFGIVGHLLFIDVERLTA
ncbi:hypothetical protein [Halovenus sp. HT40]|uniref:hypothetical protein n=1 Tax=Halovenus sp. HT40 TaxID=3126691 RepID=UPI00300ED1F0